MKKNLVILISLSLIVLLSMSMVSASWFGDIWKKITGRTTENNTNQTGCTDECSSNGAKQCSGGGYQICGNYDSDSCLDWNSVTSCSSSEVCVQGACVSNTYTCTDSDGGKDYNTRGNVVASSPTSSIDVTDLCSDSNKVVEYFCTSDKQQSGETYTCPNGCSNGACISSNTTTASCTDSDNGKNYNVKAIITSTSGGSLTESCTGPQQVREYFCTTDRLIGEEIYTCPNGCSNGVCISGSSICTDSDGGKNYNVKGRTTATLGDFTDITEVCAGNSVIEHSCASNGIIESEYYLCSNGCSNGACVSSTTTNNQSGNTTTTSTTTTTTSISAGGGGGGGGGSTSTITESPEGIFEEKIITKEEFEGEIKITTETKEITDRLGNKVEVEIKTEIKEDGTTIIEERREFLNKEGKLIKFRFRFENDGTNINIKREVEVEGKKFDSELEISERFEDDEIKLKAKLSNGNEQEIKIMPDRASEIAIEKLETNNFEIELKEVGEGENLQAVYIAKVDETGKLLGLFKVRLKSEAQIDSETGEILSLEKQWWNFLAIKLNEPKEILANNETNFTNITLPPPINITTNNFTNVTLPPPINQTNWTIPINQTNLTNVTLPPPINWSINYSCTDSDGGKKYSIKGNVVAKSPTSFINVTDLCSSSNVLIEYFCTLDKQQSGESYNCPNGCSNGACI